MNTIQIIGLKPCPFCGDKAELIYQGESSYILGCMSLKNMPHNCWCPRIKGKAGDEHADIIAWNARINPTIEPGERGAENTTGAQEMAAARTIEVDAEMLEKMCAAIMTVPLSISSTRRTGTNGLRNPGDIARAILSAIGAKFVTPTENAKE